jgi:signal transduction histidine kinase
MKFCPQLWHFRGRGRTVALGMDRSAGSLPVTRGVPGLVTPPKPVLVTVALAAACGAAALAVLNGTGQLLLAGVYASLAGTAVVAGLSYGRGRATAAAISEERRRIARDLHDGLAQELAYIRMEAARLAAQEPEGRAARLAMAAQRALEESRGAIAALRGDGDEDFAGELSAVARGLAERGGATVDLNIQPGLRVKRDRRDTLLRIMREAIGNGVRHGHATELSLEVSGADGVRMAVRDNGVGFQPGGPRRRGSFGLTSMEERARALGGDVSVRSRPGEGTLVEVELP